MKLKSLTLTLGILLLSACATNQQPVQTSRDYSELFLIGNFTWWEADENYRLSEVADNQYAAEVDLIADGQPYDFKISDPHWTPGYSCGAFDSSYAEVQINTAIDTDCFTPADNLRFTPQKTGRYRFLIDFSNSRTPVVLVSLIKA